MAIESEIRCLSLYLCQCRSINQACLSTSLFICSTDKQQELDLPSLRIEDAVAAAGSVDVRAAKKKDRVQRGPAAMSHISGVKRPLTHTNSFTGERVPLHGVETPHEEELGKVRVPLTPSRRSSLYASSDVYNRVVSFKP